MSGMFWLLEVPDDLLGLTIVQLSYEFSDFFGGIGQIGCIY